MQGYLFLSCLTFFLYLEVICSDYHFTSHTKADHRILYRRLGDVFRYGGNLGDARLKRVSEDMCRNRVLYDDLFFSSASNDAYIIHFGG
ncbi:hypothetical protein BKA83DRAFT_4179375 [Pisolithus microcarpus]|nr:hypothetical protein BKA83DRAFT_4179375 [Pisolithus microcarpus]